MHVYIIPFTLLVYVFLCKTCMPNYIILFQCHSNESLLSVREKIAQHLKVAPEQLQMGTAEKWVSVPTCSHHAIYMCMYYTATTVHVHTCTCVVGTCTLLNSFFNLYSSLSQNCS